MQAILVSPSTSRDFNTATQQSLTCTSLLRGQPRAEHSPSTLESLANRLKKLKNGVRRGMRKDLSCQQSEHTTGLSKPSSNEARSGFRKNLFGFARSVCSLTNHLNSSPKFSSEDCYKHTYRTHTSSHLQRFRSSQTGFNANQFHPSHSPST